MNQFALIVLRYMPLFFSIGVVLTTILALLPSPSVPQLFQFWDKAQHALAFTVLTITGGLAFPKKVKLVYIGLIMYGALIEIMQSALTTTRFGDVLDWLADGVGVLIGIVAYASVTSIRAQRAKTKASSGR
jgi:VanZ family protein